MQKSNQREFQGDSKYGREQGILILATSQHIIES